MDYYRDRLSAARLGRVYEVGNARIKQYLEAEIEFSIRAVEGRRRVLEAGCGYGRVLERLAVSGRSVFGFDSSLESLRQAVGLRSHPGSIELIQMDASNFSLKEDSFDAVVCIQNGISAFHVDPRKLLSEFLRITQLGGIILLSSYSEKFWDHRLEWFKAQSAEGLLGPIDYEKTGNGNIVCTDGFTATTFTPEDFEILAGDLNLVPRIIEIDESSLFCVINLE